MGYTHYWRFGPFISEEDYTTALKECRKLIRESSVPLGNWEGKGGPRLRNGFAFNGKGDESYETFAMDPEPNREVWFCKTGREAYDPVVVACLCVLQDRLGPKGISITSDGEPHEWEEGRDFARLVLGRKFEIPEGVRALQGFRDDYREEYLKAHPEYV